MNKKLIVLLGVSFVVITIGLLYSKYWQKPKAKQMLDAKQEPEARYVETDNPKLIQIRKDLNKLKSDLKKKGLYHCCIQNECNWCALHMGHCSCEKLVSEKGNEKSCPECAAAWNRKQGKVEGVDPDAIQVTTFGIYGFEKDGHHHPDSKKNETADTHKPNH